MITVLRADALSPEAVDAALAGSGGFLLDARATDLPWSSALGCAYSLFELPREAKRELAIERSLHHRGWSEMHNERDWREQLHLGRELPAPGASPSFLRLEGPNLWPRDPAWRDAVTVYMEGAAALGEAILGQVARALGLTGDPFDGVAREGYLVMKMIGYHPQQSAKARPGVAPHVDFSWLTLTLQDSRGLAVRPPGEDWTIVEPQPGSLWVHAGELLQHASGGRYPALPHRVVNQSADRTRVSIPLFLNPPLRGVVPVFSAGAIAPAQAADAPEHVHRVLTASVPVAPFHFGEAEWRRKGLNGWCATCSPPTTK
ncbi:MAG TPA: 2OG-Fe(II) oxygenase family protein [Polyangia bacterium]